MIELTKSKEMTTLLGALNIKEYTVGRDSIHLNLNGQQLMYAINATEADIQYIFGDSDAWKELCKLMPNKFSNYGK
jgi:hypothetical protein